MQCKSTIQRPQSVFFYPKNNAHLDSKWQSVCKWSEILNKNNNKMWQGPIKKPLWICYYSIMFTNVFIHHKQIKHTDYIKERQLQPILDCILFCRTNDYIKWTHENTRTSQPPPRASSIKWDLWLLYNRGQCNFMVKPRFSVFQNWITSWYII